ncbi:MAG: hypothetical protein RL764_1515 [Pseudomonadota bacterium]|jgi:hypothetical protein
MIAHRFRPVVWVVGCAFAATALYTVSLSVAAERARLEKVDRQIANTQNEIRQLQTELGTRASLRQLERWNSEVLALGAPKAGQFRATETALQTLDGGILPASVGAPAPVMVAAATAPAPAPANMTQPAAGPVQTAQVAQGAKPVAAASKSAPSAAKPAAAPAKPVALASADVRPARIAATSKSAAKATAPKPAAAKSEPAKPQRFAMLDRKLVDQRTFSEILVRAASESQTGGGKGKSAQ